MTEQEVAEVLDTCRDHDGREFENRVVDWVCSWTEPSRVADTLRTILKNPGKSFTRKEGGEVVAYSAVAFPAFFALCSHYRRRRRYAEFQQVVSEFGGSFAPAEHPLYNHLLAMLYIGLGRRGAREEFGKALMYAEEAQKKLEDHVGVLHAYADAVATARESGYPVPDADVARAVRTVERAINRAEIDDPSRAKFHATRARLYAIQGDYSSAYADIQAAVEREKQDSSDYPLRLGEHLRHYIHIMHKEHSEQVARFGDLLDEAKKENLSVLGVFAAIISIAVGSFALIAQVQLGFGATAGLIVVLALSLLVLYAGFNLLFLKPRRMGPSLAVAAGGLLLIAGIVVAVELARLETPAEPGAPRSAGARPGR